MFQTSPSVSKATAAEGTNRNCELTLANAHEATTSNRGFLILKMGLLY